MKEEHFCFFCDHMIETATDQLLLMSVFPQAE